MDLHQTKLFKSEWDAIEVPVSSDEKQILDLINDGYTNSSIRSNYLLSILSYIKLDIRQKWIFIFILNILRKELKI